MKAHPLRRRLAVAASLVFCLTFSADGAPASTKAPSYLFKADSDRPIEVYAPGEALRLRLTLENPTREPLRGARLVWTAVPWAARDDAAGLRPTGDRALDLDGGGMTFTEIQFTPSLLGWHELVIELRDASGAVLDRSSRLFTVGAPAKAAGERAFQYAVCTHLARVVGSSTFAKEIALLDQLGVNLVRSELVGWESVESAQGKWNFSKADQILAALEPIGVEVQHLVGFSTSWASTGNPNARDWNEWNKTAPRLEPWLNYVDTVLRRYGDKARYWEIWNEPDINFWRAPTEKYVELFDRTSALIKKRRPQAQVLNGGLAMVHRPERNPTFVADFIERASISNWDVFAYHDYHTFPQFLTRRAEVAGFVKKLRRPLPIWINEGGFHTLNAGGEPAQALTLVKKISTAPAYGVTAYFWYNLRNDGQDPHETEHNFGLTRFDGQPKPAYAAYQNLIRELGSARYLRSLPQDKLPAGVWAHLYQRDSSATAGASSSHVLVLWQEGAARQVPSWLGVGSRAKVAGVTDLMGNPAEVASADDGAVLKLGSEPVYVQIQAERDAAPELDLKALLETPPLVVLVPGEETRLPVRLHNPLRKAATLKLGWSTEIPGLALASDRDTFSAPAGSAVDATLRLRAAADTPAQLASPAVALRLSVPEAGLELPAVIPARIALAIPRTSATSTKLEKAREVPLRSRDDVFNLFSAQPEPAMHWKGEDDLSGVARFAYDDKALHLEIEVRDDTHAQESSGFDLWRGDSLQLGLRLDEARAEFVELGLARDASGEIGGWVYSSAPGSQLPVGALKASVRAEVVRDESAKLTTYRLTLPWAALGQKASPSGGFRLNFIVNDDDGRGRKQWLKLSDGLGDQKAPDLWRIFACQ